MVRKRDGGMPSSAADGIGEDPSTPSLFLALASFSKHVSSFHRAK